MTKFIAIVSFTLLGVGMVAHSAPPVPVARAADADDNGAIEKGSGDCLPSGAACKFGSSCCSKVCKANYTCK